MELGGWVMMLSSTAFVWSLTSWCFYKVLTAPPEEDGEVELPPGSLGG